MKKKLDFIIIVAIILGSFMVYFISTDKPTAALTIFAIILSAYSLAKSVNIAEENSKQIEKSLKITEITLEKTELERKKKDVTDQLDLFYYPLNDYLTRGPTISRCWDPAVFDKIGIHRYLATKDIIKQFEDFRKDNYSHNRESCNTLTTSVNKEVESLEIECKNLKNKLDSSNKEYEKLKYTP
jgi:hypothetical protein